MHQALRAWLAVALACAAAWVWAQPPALMLAETYRPGLPLADYWISEKLDGVRARWDGHRLVSRGGYTISAPDWFTRGWPDQPLDGELWGGRGRFEATAVTARQTPPDEAAWRSLRFMVFDLPAHGGDFSQRVSAMAALASPTNPWLQVVEQRRGTTEADLQRQLDAVVRAGGEGLMLHRGDARYRDGRSGDLLKLKPEDDAEALVVGHLPGQGRHAGRLGALLVQMPDGRRFRLGTGLTDAQRDDPPPLGTWVTYRHRGFTRHGLPRFAHFVRVRSDAELNGPVSSPPASGGRKSGP